MRNNVICYEPHTTPHALSLRPFKFFPNSFIDVFVLPFLPKTKTAQSEAFSSSYVMFYTIYFFIISFTDWARSCIYEMEKFRG